MAARKKSKRVKKAKKSKLRKIKRKARVARPAKKKAPYGAKVRALAGVLQREPVDQWVPEQIQVPVKPTTKFSDIKYGQTRLLDLAARFNNAYGASVSPTDFYATVGNGTVGDAIVYFNNHLPADV